MRRRRSAAGSEIHPIKLVAGGGVQEKDKQVSGLGAWPRSRGSLSGVAQNSLRSGLTRNDLTLRQHLLLLSAALTHHQQLHLQRVFRMGPVQKGALSQAPGMSVRMLTLSGHLMPELTRRCSWSCVPAIPPQLVT